MALTSNIKDHDWVSVRQAAARMGSTKLGPTSTPTFASVESGSLTITGLTTNSLIYPVAGLLTSLGVATDGQIPIGSTGAVPIIAGITGGTGITVTNGAGSITLSTTDGDIVHNDLSGLQGGISPGDEYYHLNSAEHTELTEWLDDVTLSGVGDVNLGAGTLTAADATLTAITVTSSFQAGASWFVFQPAIDSANVFSILDKASSAPVFSADTTNRRVGIGTITPSAKLHVEGGNVYLRRSDETTLSISAYCYSTENKASTIYFYRARGDTVTPSAVQNGDVIGFFGFVGYGTTGFSGSQGYFRCRADGDWTDASQPTRFEIATTPSSSTTAAVRLAINKDGAVGIGESYPRSALEITHTTPYVYLHNSTHEDGDGGRESRLIARGEQSGGEESSLGWLAFSHDGAADDQKGKFEIVVNDGDDGDAPSLTPVKVDSSGITYIGDGGTTNYTSWSATGVQTMTGGARVEQENAFSLDGIGKGATAPTLVRLGNTMGYQFGIGDDGYMSFEMPLNWDSTTDISVKLHVYVNEDYDVTAGEMRWQGTWSAVPETGAEAVDGATHTGTLDSGDVNISTTAKGLIEVEMGAIAAASLALHDTVFILLSRIAINAGTEVTEEPVVVHAEYEWVANKLGEAT